MTNKERYKRAFSLLRASQHDFMEVKSMNQVKVLPVRRLIALCAAVVFVVAMATVAYAADIGGIRRTVQIWIHGDQTNAVLDIRGKSYTLSYEDENGEPHSIGGGGVAIGVFGKERPLTGEEILEELNYPEVVYQEDGSVWVYYHGQKLEITDKFVDGVCYVQLQEDDQTLYLTVTDQEGYAMSPHGYVTP